MNGQHHQVFLTGSLVLKARSKLRVPLFFKNICTKILISYYPANIVVIWLRYPFTIGFSSPILIDDIYGIKFYGIKWFDLYIYLSYQAGRQAPCACISNNKINHKIERISDCD